MTGRETDEVAERLGGPWRASCRFLAVVAPVTRCDGACLEYGQIWCNPDLTRETGRDTV